MAERAVACAEAGGLLDRADHEMPPEPDGVLQRLAVAEQRRNR
jgi:hypothetical protein